MNDWVPPWRQTEQARCTGPSCTNNGQVPGPLCIAVTLDEQGWCAACARGVDSPTLDSAA